MSFRLSLNRRKRIAVWLSGALFVTVATWDLTVAGRTLYWGDVMLYFLPALEFLRNHLLNGRIPLWNPHVLCGQPYLGNPQMSVLYPTTPLLAVVTAPVFLSVSGILHVAIGWIGGYRYCRWLKASRLAAILCACTFAGSAAFLGRLQFPTMIQAMAWLPWLALLSSRLGRTPDVWRMAALGGVISLSIGAGHAQVTFMSLLMASAVALAAPVSSSPCAIARARTILRSYAWWLWALVVGLFLSAASWLPVADLVRHSARPELPLLKADRFTVAWSHLAALLWPGFLGNARNGDYWAPGNMWEPAVYVGVAPLALAIAGAAAFRACSVARLHAAVAIVGLWLAAGVWGGLYLLAYFALPGIGVFHDPARFAIITALAAAVLAGVGFDRIRPKLGKATPAAVGLAVISTLAWTARLTPTVDRNQLSYRPRALALGTAGRVYTPFRQETWDRYVSYRDYGPESGRYVHELTDTVLPNLGMRYGISEAGGYEPVPIRWAVQLEGLLRDAVNLQSPALADLAAMTQTRYVLLPVGSAVNHPTLAPVPGMRAIARVTSAPTETARLVSHVRTIGSTDRAVAALACVSGDRDWAIVNVPVVLRAPARDATHLPASVSGVRWLSSRRIEVSLGAVPADKLLILPVTFMPGWKASVDGRSATVVRADSSFLGIAVRRHSRTVSVRYDPDTYRAALFITLMTVLLIAFSFASALPTTLDRYLRQVH